MRQYEAFDFVQRLVRNYTKGHVLVAELKTGAMKDRHWKRALSEMRVAMPLSQLLVGHLWDGGLLSKERVVRDILRTAQGEMALEQFLLEIKEHWTSLELDLVNYQNKCRLIRCWDDLFEKLDEHLNQLVSMRQSPYFKVFAEDASSWGGRLTKVPLGLGLGLGWGGRLTKVRLLLDVWIDVQRRWVYLENIFYRSQDIKLQLPNEFARFKSIDSESVWLMRKVNYKLAIMEVLAFDLLRNLERLEELLSNIQRALGEYLERQRAQFSRFYFVGGEDLLEMIGSS